MRAMSTATRLMRAAMRDCLIRGEAPLVSYLLSRHLPAAKVLVFIGLFSRDWCKQVIRV